MENTTYKKDGKKSGTKRRLSSPLHKKRGIWLLRAVLIALVVVLAVGLAGRKPRFSRLWSLGSGKDDSVQRQGDLLKDKNSIAVSHSAQAEEDAVIQTVDKSSPAVVSIIITKDVPKIGSFLFDPFGDNGGSLPGGPSFFDQFFGQGPVPYGPGQGQQQPQPRGQGPDNIGQEGGTQKQEIGGGSGFVASEDGLIVTNKHVVIDSKADYTVITNDDRRYDAKVLGRDKINDVAVLKVDPAKPQKGSGVSKMDVLPLGDSNQIKTGQTVIAIGNALGEFTNTVSKGIVSGLRRNIVAGGFSGTEELDQLIQTDAAINEGNSGGPLLNLRGEVIGINVAMAQGAQNIGFALPINTVKNVIQSVQQTGKLSQPYLGVRYIPIDASLKERNNLPFEYGILVARGQNLGDLAVIPGSPADKAGIQENDIILEANGTKIDDKNSLAKVIAGFKVGDGVELKIWRKGQTSTIKAVLEEAPQGG